MSIVPAFSYSWFENDGFYKKRHLFFGTPCTIVISQDQPYHAIVGEPVPLLGDVQEGVAHVEVPTIIDMNIPSSIILQVVYCAVAKVLTDRVGQTYKKEQIQSFGEV